MCLLFFPLHFICQNHRFDVFSNSLFIFIGESILLYKYITIYLSIPLLWIWGIFKKLINNATINIRVCVCMCVSSGNIVGVELLDHIVYEYLQIY